MSEYKSFCDSRPVSFEVPQDSQGGFNESLTGFADDTALCYPAANLSAQIQANLRQNEILV